MTIYKPAAYNRSDPPLCSPRNRIEVGRHVENVDIVSILNYISLPAICTIKTQIIRKCKYLVHLIFPVMALEILLLMQALPHVAYSINFNHFAYFKSSAKKQSYTITVFDIPVDVKRVML